MGRFRTLDDVEVAGKRVLVRADLNVPVRDGRVADSWRIDRIAPTLIELLEGGAKVVLISHFGRPKGEVVPELSLEPLSGPLSAALGGRPVRFVRNCIGPAAEEAVAALAPGGIALLENLRFHAEEEANGPELARGLAALADLYVNDAFSVSHRAHASIVGVARLLPAAAGRLMQAELEALTRALETPERPLAAIVGGAKVSTKLELLVNLTARVDALVVGGAMANTFLHALGKPVGRSLCERDLAATAREVMARGEAAGCEVVLPEDAVVAGELAPGVETRVVPVDAVPGDAMILDLGPRSVAAIEALIAGARTLVWNGPLGAFEIPPFDAGTTAVARAAARRSRAGKLRSVAGGGDTIAALSRAGVIEDFGYVSTGGGAFLHWLEGKELPGVAALEAAP